MRTEHQANEALAASIAARKANDWTTPSRSGYNPDNARLERSHMLADSFMLGMLVVTIVGIISKIFG